MEITEVRVFPVEEEKLKGYVTITIDDAFVIRDLKIISGNNGLFVAMPSKKRRDGTFRDIAHPINNDVRKMLEEKVLKAYEEAGQSSPASEEGETSEGTTTEGTTTEGQEE